jgi:phosphoribosylformimino-5-aminoimidazole carboxamide ribotide isomerase
MRAAFCRPRRTDGDLPLVIAYPTIDLLGGRVVRLRHGDFGQHTEYAEDPVTQAREFEAAGARALHVVDLDGARDGRPTQMVLAAKIAEAVSIPVQYGGGLRDRESISHAMDGPFRWIVVGTAARDPDLLTRMVERLGERLVVAIDAKGGRVATHGWQRVADISSPTMAERLVSRGVERFIYTEVTRDGTMQGPDLRTLRTVVAAAGAGRVLASGGIGSLDDVRALARLRLAGVLIGKALYEGAFTIAEAQAALDDPGGPAAS